MATAQFTAAPGVARSAVSLSVFDSVLEMGLTHTYMCRDLDRYRAYVIKLTLPA